MKLTYTVRAGRDYLRLREFIKKKNPAAARRISKQLRKTIQRLVDQSNLGVPVEELDGFRELIARDYTVRYRIIGEEIVILKIWHHKENL